MRLNIIDIYQFENGKTLPGKLSSNNNIRTRVNPQYLNPKSVELIIIYIRYRIIQNPVSFSLLIVLNEQLYIYIYMSLMPLPAGW